MNDTNERWFSAFAIVILSIGLVIFLLGSVNQAEAVRDAENANDTELQLFVMVDSEAAIVNDQITELDFAPLLIEHAVYLPLRNMVETMGGQVLYSKSELALMWQGERKVLSDQPANLRQVGGTTYIGARFLSEQMGLGIYFDATKVLVMHHAPQSPSAANPPSSAKLQSLRQQLMPYAPYTVWQKDKLLNGYSNLKAAKQFAVTMENVHIEQEGTVIWDNKPPYLVKQSGRLINRFSTFAEAVRYAEGYASTEVVYKQQSLWAREKQPKPIRMKVEKQFQLPMLARGCEVTSLSMLLSYHGIKADKMKLAKEVKKVPMFEKGSDGKIYRGNPYEGFVGNIYTFREHGLGVYHGPIAELAERYAPGRVVDLTGARFDDLLHVLAAGMPVWVIHNTHYDWLPSSYWTTWKTKAGDIRITYKEHSVVVTGFDERYVYIADPLNRRQKVEIKRFEAGWNQMGKQAVTILPSSA
ncbi:C39 family peptidase [Marinicrinis sediminis]|uniref:C39 family peptidase n=1 Tax=Marinicrinis sediminis TaxID=1652465 RepID=A0ABW5RG64_9BACL